MEEDVGDFRDAVWAVSEALSLLEDDARGARVLVLGVEPGAREAAIGGEGNDETSPSERNAAEGGEGLPLDGEER